MSKTNTESILRNYPHPYITDIELRTLLKGTPDSYYAKIKRLTEVGKLLHIRRGLYSISEAIGNQQKAHPFEIAQYIYGPSCISLESALSFHQLIPEAVYTVTSVCTKRSKEFNTRLGLFSYIRLPLENFYMEAQIVEIDGYKFFMAKPWRAICDYVFCYKKEWTSFEPLLDSLRISLEDLPSLSNEEANLLSEYYQHKRLNKFLAGITK